METKEKGASERAAGAPSSTQPGQDATATAPLWFDAAGVQVLASELCGFPWRWSNGSFNPSEFELAIAVSSGGGGGGEQLVCYRHFKVFPCTLITGDDGVTHSGIRLPAGAGCVYDPEDATTDLAVLVDAATGQPYLERINLFEGFWRHPPSFLRDHPKCALRDDFPKGADADWDHADVAGSVARFAKNGFTVLPRKTVPPAMLAAALRHARGESGADAALGDQACHDAFRKTQAWDVVTTLLGSHPAPDYGGWYQIASIDVDKSTVLPPSRDLLVECLGGGGVGAHVDVGHHGNHLHKFDLLVGIPLTTTAVEWAGNFGVCPGSHVALAEAIDARGGYDEFCKDTGKGIHHSGHWNALRWLPVEQIPTKALCIEAGQPYIAHQLTMHFVQHNIVGTERRDVLYFRVYHPEQHAVGCYDKELWVKPFKNFPRLGGTWKPVCEGDAARFKRCGPWVRYEAQDAHADAEVKTYWLNTETNERRPGNWQPPTPPAAGGQQEGKGKDGGGGGGDEDAQPT
eukprot:g2655.t1